jgi:coenzyme PQQ biosynthesis protein PqqD
MAPPQDSSQPHLAAGCRWGADNKSAENKSASEQERVILFPEGAIRLQGTGRLVLERCDGQRTFGAILSELQAQFGDADPAKIRSDISQFLEQLRHKRIVDY